MASEEVSQPLVVKANPDRKKVIIRSNRIPEKILNDPEIARDCSVLPSNYNFEIHKTVWQVKKNNSTRGILKIIKL